MLRNPFNTKNNFLPKKSETTAKSILVSWKIIGRHANMSPIVTMSMFLFFMSNGNAMVKTPLMKELRNWIRTVTLV